MVQMFLGVFIVNRSAVCGFLLINCEQLFTFVKTFPIKKKNKGLILANDKS
tara:strand:- start:5342 stop:5494 length:153 start_codon:yes stop_codon:yes gene_type:complete